MSRKHAKSAPDKKLGEKTEIDKKPLGKKVILEEEVFLDQALRPSRWDDYIGQKNIKENLRILLTAASERKHPPEHLLFYGPPGLGKTTLAHLIAKEIGAQIKVTSGPAIERVGDLASILTNLSPGDILFIDEVHRLNKAIEEVLYPAMESGQLDIILGKGPSARTIQLELPPFTLIAATTRIALLSSPLRSRFGGGVFRLEFYSNDEIEEIIKRSAKILAVEIEKTASQEIAKRSRFTPRTANYLLKRARDFAQVNRGKLSKETVNKALVLLGIDDLGLGYSDRSLLKTLIEKFGGGPVGLNTLSAALSEEQSTIEEVHEPYLLQLGLIERTPRGRTATTKAYEHLKIKNGVSAQEKLYK
ncbi:MAG: Holliday junction ATP-dependent DNA helicase RuvB [Parcubacteria group bacterium GW2011_GWA2_44_15]|nr:MAG: Holliday junction ATP-dependent DNA helicase RuvB [Parcubacteria group bacterium GW2011_GWA2_44_15]